MIYTVSDFLNSYERDVRLIAGEGGLSRRVGQVGILDYELMPGLKTSYQRVNFEPDQLVLSTFLYAKDDPWLIGEAVKYLVSRGASGLVIKNVLHLDVPDSALRYANARDFPLFLTTSDGFFFDVVIAGVDQRVRELADASFAQNELDLMTRGGDASATASRAGAVPNEVREHALRLNPSFKEEHLAVFVAEPLTPSEFARALSLYHESDLSGLGNLFTPYGDGLLYVATAASDVLGQNGAGITIGTAATGGTGSAGRTDAIERLVNTLRADVLQNEETAPVGVSDVHYTLEEMGLAVLEARRAALLARDRSAEAGRTVLYADLGVMRALLPFANEPQMRAFADSVLEPIRSFDAETGSSLMETLAAYCDAGESVEKAAHALGQHPNTVRYRLDKVAAVTGLSYKSRPQMEELSIARKIELCQHLLCP